MSPGGQNCPQLRPFFLETEWFEHNIQGSCRLTFFYSFLWSDSVVLKPEWSIQDTIYTLLHRQGFFKGYFDSIHFAIPFLLTGAPNPLLSLIPLASWEALRWSQGSFQSRLCRLSHAQAFCEAKGDDCHFEHFPRGWAKSSRWLCELGLSPPHFTEETLRLTQLQ